MARGLTAVRPALLTGLFAILAALAVKGFMSDMGSASRPSWFVSIGIAAILAGTASALPRDSLARALLLFFALPVFGFLLVYDVLDILADPFLVSDWAVAAVAALLVVLLELGLFMAMQEED